MSTAIAPERAPHSTAEQLDSSYAIDRSVWWLAALIALPVAAAFMVAYQSTDPARREWYDNLHWTLADAGAILLAWWGYRRAAAHADRETQRWFIWGLVMYAVGQLVWDVQAVFGWQPFPGPADVFYPLLGVFMGVGLFRGLWKRLTPQRRDVLGIDLPIVLIQTLLLLLLVYLRHAPDASSLQVLQLMAYPVVMIGAVAVGVVFALEVGIPMHWCWLLVLGGLSIKGAAWMQWNLLDFHGRPASGTWLNFSFSVAAWCCGLGAACWQVRPWQHASRIMTGHVYNVLIPLVPVMLAVLSMFLVWEVSAVPDALRMLVFAGAVLVVVLAVVRQGLGLSERERLLRSERQMLENEQQHRVVAQRLELATQGGGFGVWDVDLVNSRTVWDERMYALYGVTPECGLKPIEIVNRQTQEADRLRAYRALDATVSENWGASVENEVTWPNGEKHYLEAYFRAVFDEQGQRVRITGLTHDITDMVTARRALAESEAELRAIFENSAVGIVLLDAQLNIMRLNAAVTTWLPPGDGTTTLKMQDMLHPDDLQAGLDQLTELARGQRSFYQAERRYRFGASEFRWARVTMYPVQLHGRQCFVGLFEDINERKQVQMALEQAQLHERQLREDFTYSLFKVQEQERQRIANELHDSLGQSLSVIRNRTQLALEKTADDAPLRSQLVAIMRVASEAISETRRLAHNLRPLHIEQLGLTVAIEQLVNEFEQSSHLAVTRHIEMLDDAIAPAHLTQVYRLVQEALSNISKHARASQVDILVERDVRVARLVIRDNGQGFDPALMRAAGLGLVSMHERAHMLGGTVHVASGFGQGTTVTIELPVANVDVPDVMWTY